MWMVCLLATWVGAVTCTHAVQLGVSGAQFTFDGKPTFLLGVSYYGGLGAPREFVEADFTDLSRAGFNWVRVWATWAAFDHDVSAVTSEGEPREPYLSRLLALVEAADVRGMAVDVTLSRGAGLSCQSAHLRAVETLATVLKPWRNVYFDLSNERDVRDARYVSFEELRELRDVVKALDPERLVTASGNSDPGPYLQVANLDFFSPHLGRYPGVPAETEGKTRAYLARMTELGRVVPVHYQEPFRRDYNDFQPDAADFMTDLQGAVRGGAAGWCLHNGSPAGALARQRTRPRRSFDLRAEEGRLMAQLDQVELEVVKNARQWLQAAMSWQAR